MRALLIGQFTARIAQMFRQFTATVYIIKNSKALLLFHRKHEKWLPPGGHLNPNEIPSEAALREAHEETGLKIALIPQENIWIDRWNAKSFERPYLCLLEEIPAYKDQPPHQHIDMIYVAKPLDGPMTYNLNERDAIEWFTLAQIEDLQSDKEIFEETKQVLRKILQDPSLH